MATREYEPTVVLATTDFDVVGTRPLRHDGTDKVTGRALYGADFTAAGLIHGAVLRGPHAHAHIRSIDASRAEAAQGVLAVVTDEDFPDVHAYQQRDEIAQKLNALNLLFKLLLEQR